jgi:predicted HD superfamily hydrolase involved in NAD metabolism
VQNNYESIIKEKLGKKRYTHSINVAEVCVKLAKKYNLNNLDIEKAHITGILHDVMKEQPPEELHERIKNSSFMEPPDPVELETHALWHALAGSCYVRDELKITDEDIINSIRFHTIGRPGMTVLEKIIYLGDLISKDRDFHGIEKYRAYAFDNLDSAMYHALKLGIGETLQKNGKIPVYTFQAYNYYNQFKH